jgi:hypothetical protein
MDPKRNKFPPFESIVQSISKILNFLQRFFVKMDFQN